MYLACFLIFYICNSQKLILTSFLNFLLLLIYGKDGGLDDNAGEIAKGVYLNYLAGKILIN